MQQISQIGERRAKEIKNVKKLTENSGRIKESEAPTRLEGHKNIR